MSTDTSASASGAFTLGGDLEVNRLGFGAMRITGEGVWGDPPDREVAKRVLRRAHALGCTLIDTADSYGPDVSERLIAEALHPYPDDLVVATKAGLTRPGPGKWVPDGRPEHLREAVEGSLRRLRTERIDVPHCTRPTAGCPTPSRSAPSPSSGTRARSATSGSRTSRSISSTRRAASSRWSASRTAST